MVILTDFEEGPDGITTGGSDPYSLYRRNGVYNLDDPGSPPVDRGHNYSYRASYRDGTTAGSLFNQTLVSYVNGTSPMATPSPQEGSWAGLIRGRHRIETSLSPANSMGIRFKRGDVFNSSIPTAALPSRVIIDWVAEGGSAAGFVECLQTFGSMVITEGWAGADIEHENTFTVSIPAPSTPGAGPVTLAWHPDWLELEMDRNSWSLRIAGGPTLASSAVPLQGRRFSLNAYSHNATATLSAHLLANNNPWLMVDAIRGELGSWASPPAVRMFPRDDRRGMSSAPRIWPAPKSQRIIGGHQ